MVLAFKFFSFGVRYFTSTIGTSNFGIISGFFTLFISFIITFLILSLIITIIFKIILLIFKIKLSFSKIWNISIYSLIPLVIASIIYITKDAWHIHLIHIGKFLFETNYFIWGVIDLLFLIYAFILLITGIFIFAKISKKKFKKTIFIGVVILILIQSSYDTYRTIEVRKDILDENNVTHTDFYTKIGEDIVFTNNDIVAVCLIDDCSGLVEYNPCYETTEEWICHYEFNFALNKEAANRFAEIINTLDITENQTFSEFYLNKKIEYYLDGQKFDEALIDADMKGKDISFSSLFGSGEGKTKKEAMENALSEMRSFQYFLYYTK